MSEPINAIFRCKGYTWTRCIDDPSCYAISIEGIQPDFADKFIRDYWDTWKEGDGADLIEKEHELAIEDFKEANLERNAKTPEDA